jgi:hypothetical protein
VDPQSRRVKSHTGTGKRAKVPGQQPARVCESIEGYTIHGDSEEKINILGIIVSVIDINKVRMNMCLILSDYRYRDV